MRNCNSDIDKLLGTKTRIIVAERKNASIASAVFAKSSFSKNLRALQETQECNGGHGRKCCEIMTLERSVTLWKNSEEMEKKVTLDFRCDCNTEHIIYIFVCNLYPDNDSFYIGQSVNSCRDRANGHRGDSMKRTLKSQHYRTTCTKTIHCMWVKSCLIIVWGLSNLPPHAILTVWRIILLSTLMPNYP